jgi:plastocyanin
MTWLWRICFRQHALKPVVLVLSLAPVMAGSVTGSIELIGSRDEAVRKHKDYSGVVVWLEPSNGRAGARPQPRLVEMVQKKKKFTPHLLAIPVGSTVGFPNLDPIFHNAFSNYGGQIFDLALYPPGTSRLVTFSRPGVVRVFCNIHPTMSAVIVVLATRYFAVTTPNGAFSIPDVPPGEYYLNVFHERASEETLDKLRRKIVVETASLALPEIQISETGYLQTPHKNKFGKDYPPALDERTVYPGATK